MTSTKWMGISPESSTQDDVLQAIRGLLFLNSCCGIYLRSCHRQVFRLCRADFKIACCVWVVMFVKQYTGLQEMLCDQYWNKFNIMQPVLVHVIETSFFSKITWLQRQWIDSLLKGLGASSYAVLSLCMIYCDFFQNFY